MKEMASDMNHFAMKGDTKHAIYLRDLIKEMIEAQTFMVVEYPSKLGVKNLDEVHVFPCVLEDRTSKKKKKLSLEMNVDSITLIDGTSVMKSYPIFHLRRWASSTLTLTLDFGEWEDEYVALGTNKGDEISKLLSKLTEAVIAERRKKGYDRFVPKTGRGYV
eukprot:TRINITY_DN6349_c0_g1_i6.p1 TRINITY_DN6349_c0_g1~~TRINITY_DN6349_c0_g1_i6.p1  ORF type:complete len:162 (-),score=39.37 TRINITY_DN6349_c0_g1_i6:216-701(-)